MSIRYLPEQDGQGFVDVIASSTGERFALLGYLKLNFLRTANNRDYFIPYEGKWKNRKLSITRKSDGGSYLVTGIILEGATIIINPIKTHLWYGTGSARVGPIFAKINKSPIPDGTYEFLVSDERHTDYGNNYLPRTPYATVWYPIPLDKDQNGVDDERYLHCGLISDGCVTVGDFAYWTKLYKYLYNRRLRDGVTGTIRVDSRYMG
jgi:hypothetical protein